MKQVHFCLQWNLQKEPQSPTTSWLFSVSLQHPTTTFCRTWHLLKKIAPYKASCLQIYCAPSGDKRTELQLVP